MAVTGTFILDTVLFLAVARFMWHTATWKLVLLGVVFLTVEVAFFSSNLTKISHGAWIPLCAGALASLGDADLAPGTGDRDPQPRDAEGSLQDFLYEVRMADPPVHRVGNVAVYLSPDKQTTPLALKAEVEHHGVFHDKVLIVSIETVSVPHVDAGRRVRRRDARAGPVQDPPHHPAGRLPRQRSTCPALIGPGPQAGPAAAQPRPGARVVLPVPHHDHPDREHGMHRWRKSLFTAMARNAASPIDHFNLPVSRTVTVGSQIGAVEHIGSLQHPRRGRRSQMADSVYRVTEVIGTSTEGWAEAAKVAVETAAKSVRDLRVAEVIREDVTIENGQVVNYRVRLRDLVQVRLRRLGRAVRGPPVAGPRSPGRAAHRHPGPGRAMQATADDARSCGPEGRNNLAGHQAGSPRERVDHLKPAPRRAPECPRPPSAWGRAGEAARTSRRVASGLRCSPRSLGASSRPPPRPP